jgi:hypothetical protein
LSTCGKNNDGFDMATSNRKKLSSLSIVLVGLFLMLLIPVALTGMLHRDPLTDPTPEPSFPDTDIVYKSGTNLGFVNADGSRLTTIHFSVPYNNFVGTWQSPFVMRNGRTIFVTYANAPGHPGKIFSAQPGEIAKDCGRDGTIRLTVGGDILLNTGETLERVDCDPHVRPLKVQGGVTGALSPNEQYSVEIKKDEERGIGDRKPILTIFDVINKKEWTIGEGDFPAWSRDSQRFAYTGPDGIYIVQNGPDAKPRRLIPLESDRPGKIPVYQEDIKNHYYPPMVSWSPNGQWLVYHVFGRDPVDPQAKDDARYYSIVKVNVQTGETTKILDGGYSPYWRWP